MVQSTVPYRIQMCVHHGVFICSCLCTVTLHLDPPCVRSGQTVYMRCCIATENVTDNAFSWCTSIKDKWTTFIGSGLPNASFVNRTVTGQCELHSFIATQDINGTEIFCLHGDVLSNNVTVQVTTDCEFAMHMYA